MKWSKCRKPEEWVCDNCDMCGGCKTCPSVDMYHRGDYALCERCYRIELEEITASLVTQELDDSD